MDTDIALASRLAGDLEAAFPALVAAHVDPLYTIALRSLGDPRDAEEVAQDTLVRAYGAIATYPAERTAALLLRPWLASIAVNLVRNRRRNLADRFPPATLDGLAEAGVDLADSGADQPEVVAEQRAGSEAMALLLLQLPSYLRVAVVLRHVDGLSVAETAVALGRPEGTIKAQVARGLERLRQLASATPSIADQTEPRRAESQGAVARLPNVRSVVAGRAPATAEVLR